MRTLLLADDNITVQRVIALTFAAEDIQVVSCNDGQQAMERMAAQPPDIVLAGTSLPTMNGYDLARFIRNQPELASIPVLLLSGAFENIDEARVVSSGASGVIEKPVEPNNVIGRVKELLGLKSEAKPAAPGRLITPGNAPKGKTAPAAAC
jgi:CheY-like chemotaxis protein